MNRTRTFGVALGAALVMAPIGAVLAPSAALASYSGSPGRIVFDGVIPNTDQDAIFSVNPDGSDLKQLTDGSATALGPDVSSDGSKIVYSSGVGTDTAELWVMDANGDNKHQITHDNTRDWYASWSPDGSTIAFRSNQTGDGDIYTIPADGGLETRLTDAPGLDSVPEYSPDGTKILFHSTREDPNPSTCDPCTEGVYVMDANGGDQTKLVGNPNEEDRFPNWSPDGSHIVFSREPIPNVTPDDGLYIANADGSGVSRVNGPDEYASAADFSPDGTSLVFQEGAYVMKTVPVTGGTPRVIETNAEASPLSIDWSTIPGTHPQPQTPVASAVSPSDGPEAGGTTITVDGHGLLGTTAVHVGTAAATDVQVVSDAELTAVVPAGTGQADVTVTNSAGTSATVAQDRYTYDPPQAPPAPPVVTGITPASGETGGGTSVVITGSGLSGATGVNFGSTAATSFTQDSDTQITAVSPAGTGTVDVTVSTPNGTSGTSQSDQFTYTDPTPPAPPAPSVSKVTPATGPRFGGTTVTVTGTGFTGATKVTVGGATARFLVVSSTKLMLRTPASSTTGARQIRITGPGGTSPTGRASTFTYGNPPTVTRLSPTSGTIRGGTTVTVTGTGFTGATAVHFGSAAGTHVHVVSATKLTVTSPARAVGAVDLRVTGPYGTSATVNADRYTYKRP